MLRTSTFTRVSWYDYVRQMASGDSNERIAAKIGVTGATVGRWKFREPNPRDVAAFARIYQRPVLEAMIEAGFITVEEAGQTAGELDPRRLSNDELVAEVARRLQAEVEGTNAADISTSDRLKRRQSEGRQSLESRDVRP